MPFVIGDAGSLPDRTTPPEDWKLVGVTATEDRARELVTTPGQFLLEVDGALDLGTAWPGVVFPLRPEPSPPPPPQPGGSVTVVWRGDLRESDIGRGAEFFRHGSSPWPISRDISGGIGRPVPSCENIPGTERLSIDRGPDGQPAIRIFWPNGPIFGVEFRVGIPELARAKAAAVKLDYFIPGDLVVPSGGQKIAAGLYSGDGSRGNGEMPDVAQGWLVRFTHKPHGAKLYSYHLNRNVKPAPDGRLFGQSSDDGTGPLPRDRWFTLKMKISLNSPGEEDGKVQMFVDDVLKGEIRRCRFDRGTTRFPFSGILFHEMGGGSEEAPANLSPRRQAYFVRNLRALAYD